jgi:thiamine-phosphate pyrophosphorylase
MFACHSGSRAQMHLPCSACSMISLARVPCPNPIMIGAKNCGAMTETRLTIDDAPNRCRLVLTLSPGAAPDKMELALADALAGGDVASVILFAAGAAEREFQSFCEKCVPLIQKAEAAALIADNSQIAGRTNADGVHVTGTIADLKDAMNSLSPRLIVGAAAKPTRDDALDKGELRPDYVFFGKLDGDTHPEPHPKNVEMGEWWASMIELPCIVMGGYVAQSVCEIARSGAEFAAMSAAVFGEGRSPGEEVRKINAMLDEAGEFEEAAHAD